MVTRIAVITIVALLFASLFLVYAVTNYLTIHNQGHINTIANITATPDTNLWGKLSRGQSYFRSVLLINLGDTACENLNMTYDDLSFYGANLTWDSEGMTLWEHTNMTVTFTLTVYLGNYTDGDFNFDIHVGGD